MGTRLPKNSLEQQGDFPQRSLGSIMIDNSTLQSALGLLRGDDFYRKPGADLISLTSLRQLIDSIVLFDCVFVDRLDFDWALTGHDSEVQESVRKVVKGFSLPNKHRDTLREVALRRSRRIARTDEITQLVRALTPTSETFWALQRSDSRQEADIVHLELGKTVGRYQEYGFEDSEAIAFANYRTTFYFLVSEVWGVPYCPHPVRIPFIAPYLQSMTGQGLPSSGVQVVTDARHLTSIRKWAVEQVTDVRAQRMVALNETLGTVYEVETPLLLGSILSESESREDIIPRALELRDSLYARAYRAWAARIDDAVERGLKANATKKWPRPRVSVTPAGGPPGGRL